MSAQDTSKEMNIVHQLRAMADPIRTDEAQRNFGPLLLLAAAAIERLQRENRQLRQWYSEVIGSLAPERLSSLPAEPGADYDGAPYCSHCGARKKADCDCGPIARNE